jgi:hypothetical protein
MTYGQIGHSQLRLPGVAEARLLAGDAGHLNLRLPATQHSDLKNIAERSGITMTAAARVLILEALDARRKPAVSDADPTDDTRTELLMHVLIAIEQVIRLLESVTARSAVEVLGEATRAAQCRLSLSQGQEPV